MITILFAQSRKEVADYYSLNWGVSSITIGPMVLARKPIRTQEPICDIPSNQRDRAIIQLLAENSIIPYVSVNPHSLGMLKEVRETNLSSRMSIVS